MSRSGNWTKDGVGGIIPCPWTESGWNVYYTDKPKVQFWTSNQAKAILLQMYESEIQFGSNWKREDDTMLPALELDSIEAEI